MLCEESYYPILPTLYVIYHTDRGRQNAPEARMLAMRIRTATNRDAEKSRVPDSPAMNMGSSEIDQDTESFTDQLLLKETR